MTPKTVKQVAAMEPDEYIASFTGTISAIFPRKGGVTKRGKDWTCQGVVCKEGETTVELKLWNRPTLAESWMGSTIHITAHEGEAMKVAEYRGKVQLSVPEEAHIERAGGAAQQAAPARAASPAQSGAMEPAGRGPTAKVFSARCAVAMVMATDAANYAMDNAFKRMGHDATFLTPEMFQSMVVEIYGSLERAGYINTMPVTVPEKGQPAPRAAEPPPSEPPPPAAQPEPDDDIPF